ncbi:MAG: alpha amylase N-terminal ig-like domain-containing protein [Oscillospiraceae bacterium]|nr:alpha amylase N-terminal ig-like domain-containing protein [Oscillospiraceae bacterium]
MENWLISVHSDGTESFLSNPNPNLSETVKIRIRLYENAPVKNVVLISYPNGTENFTEMRPIKTERGFIWYETELKITENRMPYQFALACENKIYYYTQRGISTHIPDHSADFVLLADYKQPEWVRDSVFYQIFPERFCNGNPENDVKTGEYSQNGFPAVKIPDWNSVPEDYAHAHCLDFYGGDLEGITEKIPYLKKLGVNALYLNPIFAAPSVHKYDCLDYFHVDPHFGGDEALEKLCAALHENGMKIILDISINHTGTDHKWFNRDGAWFEKSVGAYNNPDSPERGYYFFGEENSYLGWFGVETMPVLNYTSDSLRNAIYRAKDSVLKKWLRPPYSIDGWRFDVADVFARNNEIQLDKELWPKICRSIREENPKAYILAEDWGDCPEHLQGDQWDSPMNYFGCGRIIRQFYGEADSFMSRSSVLGNIKYKATAGDVKTRVIDHLSKIPFVFSENQFNLFDSHDVPRLHCNPDITPEYYRGAVIFQFLLPGAPSVYYGDEAAIDGLPETMEGCRYPMPWDSDFEKSDTYKLYSRIISLRRKKGSLRHGSMKFLHAEGNILAIARFTETEAFIGVISNGEKDEKILLPLGAIGAESLLNEVFGTDFDCRKIDEYTAELTVKAGCSYLFECEMNKI